MECVLSGIKSSYLRELFRFSVQMGEESISILSVLEVFRWFYSDDSDQDPLSCPHRFVLTKLSFRLTPDIHKAELETPDILCQI